MMGSLETEAGRENVAGKESDEGPRHRVNVPPFWMGKFEVTQAQWKEVMGNDANPSRFKGDELPVERVSWEDAQDFLDALNLKLGLQNKGREYRYRLPSEAEWEYAARAGTDTPFAFGETITPQIVNYDGGYPYASAPKGIDRNQTVVVGSLGVANAFGLFDMHGNVSEWCEEVHRENYNGAPTDGSAWFSGGSFGPRSQRGGSWVSSGRSCRSAFRGLDHPRDRDIDAGFRVVLPASVIQNQNRRE
jgi:formylglycine-generating enzyme required for sulfatase activity